ncbi:ketopantoate reductase family protein [Gluconacetobacter tumulicola]|uniref:NAD(P)-binding domain-containing protein n=1 Tax=Gluconacetobacter tumulicola TaxID=1017177 RepID=A0A7W4JBQ5_9PROT|nr:2-dehydropantoate 2-reductase N-terminal domain-containing protein [Gluconacetobacter tumulicola]MBB2178306.1 NAD(P)-binding domain-containing protein [Gluconacetobacter tumulicola]
MPSLSPSPSPSSISLRIAVLGCGKIGSTFAFQLARAGNDVTVIARPMSARLQQLRRDNGIVTIKGERADVQIADTLDEQIPYDLIIVTVVDYQVDALLPALQRSAAKSIQFMFVSFDPERLRDAVGADRCSFGMPFVQAVLDKDGRLKPTISKSQKTIMSQQRWVDVFNTAGLPAAYEPNMPLWLRCHVPLCIGFESVSVAGELRGGGASWGEAFRVARGVKESFGLIRGLGYEIYPQSKARISNLPTFAVAFLLWMFSRVKSMRELLASGKNECRALIDEMLAAAPRAKPTVNVSRIQAIKPA